MNNVILYICLFFFIISISHINAQIEFKGEEAILNSLTDKTKKKISKADKFLQQASKFDNRIEQYEKQIENYRNSSGKIKAGKIRKLQKKRNQAILQSKPIFEDAFKTRYKAYNKQLDIISNKTANNKAQELRNNASIKYKEAKKLFSKAENVAKTKDQVEYIVQGRQKFIETISLQINSIDRYTNNTPEVIAVKSDTSKIIKEEVSNDTTALDQNKQTTTIPPTTPAVTTVAPPVPVSTTIPVTEVPTVKPKPVTIVKEKELGNTFLSVQVIATTRPATSDEIRNVYKGNMKVMEFKSGEYYRYNVGKFRSVEDAKKFISINKIKGFVVAYKDSKRITVHQALSILATE